MRSAGTLFRNIENMKELMTEPEWTISFKFMFLDGKDNVDLDLLILMKKLGFDTAYTLCNSYYSKFPLSIGMPLDTNIDSFFDYLIEIGIYKKDAVFGGLEQTENCREVYESLVPPTD